MKSQSRFFYCLFFMLAASCLKSSTVEAIFASVKSLGMAATAISYPLDSLAGAYNPAGNALVGSRFDLEAGWLRSTGHTDVSGNLTLNPEPPPPLILNPLSNGKFEGMRTKDIFPAGFGINKVWCLAPDWELTTGLILYNRDYQKTTYKNPLVLLGTSKAGLEYLHETLSPLIAIRWCESHTIGISADFHIERVKVNGIQNFDNPLLSIAPGRVTNRGYNYSRGWGFTLGYLGQITNYLRIGVTYQPKATMSRLDKYEGFLAQRGRLDIPRRIGAGISYDLLPCLVIAFDVEHIQWSRIKSLHNPLLDPGTATLNLLGSSQGPGFGFQNQLHYRVGLDWQIDESLAMRIGFRHANSPIRSSQTAVNSLTLDTVENFITVGGTWSFDPCHEISLLFAWGFEHKIKGKNSVPESFGGGEIDLVEQKYALGIAWGRKF